MTNSTLARVRRGMLGVVGGGMLLQFTSCSDEVQAAVLAGFESTSLSIASALIAALFEGLG